MTLSIWIQILVNAFQEKKRKKQKKNLLWNLVLCILDLSRSHAAPSSYPGLVQISITSMD